jgi:hypothetical protein
MKNRSATAGNPAILIEEEGVLSDQNFSESLIEEPTPFSIVGFSNLSPINISNTKTSQVPNE